MESPDRLGVGGGYGGQNMVEPLRRVVLRPPDESFAVADPGLWNYTAVPDLGVARREHATLVGLLRDEGVEVHLHEAPQSGRADAVYRVLREEYLLAEEKPHRAPRCFKGCELTGEAKES